MNSNLMGQDEKSGPEVVMGKKIKILITDTAPLYPPQWGGPKRIWYLFSNFPDADFEFTYVGVTFTGSPESKSPDKQIRNNFVEKLTLFPPHYALWHRLERIVLKNTHLDLFVYLAMNTDWRFKRLLNAQAAKIVICSHPWAWPCLRRKPDQFLIYDAHNCEYLLLAEILKKRLLKNLVLRQVKKIEGELCRQSDLILACSTKEKEDLVKLYKINPDKVAIVTNGAQIKEITGPARKEDSRKALGLSSFDKVVVFVGMYYKPNIDAAQFIIRKVAPALPDFKFLLAGEIARAFVSVNLPPNTKFLGRVTEEQLDTVLRAADLAINPVFDGAGINIKMLDYLAYGLPVVTTSCGARGIETEGQKVMLEAGPDDFADTIRQLSVEADVKKRLAEAGRRLVARRYDWQLISRQLQEIILARLRNVHGC